MDETAPKWISHCYFALQYFLWFFVLFIIVFFFRRFCDIDKIFCQSEYIFTLMLLNGKIFVDSTREVSRLHFCEKTFLNFFAFMFFLPKRDEKSEIVSTKLMILQL